MNLTRPNHERPNIDRPMANIFFEIKRNLPHEARDGMKIAAPDVGDRLIDIYQASNNPALRDLIEKFFDRAGSDWLTRLKPPKRPRLSFYRSQA